MDLNKNVKASQIRLLNMPLEERCVIMFLQNSPLPKSSSRSPNVLFDEHFPTQRLKVGITIFIQWFIIRVLISDILTNILMALDTFLSYYQRVHIKIMILDLRM